MNEVCFGDREGKVKVFCPVGDDPVHALKNADIGAVGRGRNSKAKVIHIR